MPCCLSYNNCSQNAGVQLWLARHPRPVSQASFCAPALLSCFSRVGMETRTACLPALWLQVEPPPPRPPAQESHFLLSYFSSGAVVFLFFFFMAPDLFLHPFWVTFVVTGFGGWG